MNFRQRGVQTCGKQQLQLTTHSIEVELSLKYDTMADATVTSIVNAKTMPVNAQYGRSCSMNDTTVAQSDSTNNGAPAPTNLQVIYALCL